MNVNINFGLPKFYNNFTDKKCQRKCIFYIKQLFVTTSCLINNFH